MPMPLKSFDEFTNDQIAAMQALSGVPLDFTPGSVFLAQVEANSGNALWLEGQAQYTLAIARAQTSTGTDLDTWVEQFGLEREPATAATGNVTFSRFTANLAATIPVGSLVLCPTTGISYSVFADTTNPLYVPAQNAYIIPIATSSGSVPVMATTPGIIGNVIANQITVISSVIPYVDTVTNPSPLVNGTNAESDAALRIRFVDYINGLSKATKQAIDAAALGVIGVVREISVENMDIGGGSHLGYFYVIVDDGSGNASPTLISNVSAAVGAVRGLTIAYTVYGPIQVPIDVTAHVFTDGSVPDATVQDNVETALENYILSQSFDALFPYSQIPAIIFSTNTSTTPDSPIMNVTNWTLNGGSSDVQLTGREIAVVGTLTIIMNA